MPEVRMEVQVIRREVEVLSKGQHRDVYDQLLALVDRTRNYL